MSDAIKREKEIKVLVLLETLNSTNQNNQNRDCDLSPIKVCISNTLKEGSNLDRRMGQCTQASWKWLFKSFFSLLGKKERRKA